MGFIDTMRAEVHAVESICRVLREQDCQIAARTYRAWKQAGRTISARTVSDAHVVNAVREIAWTITTGPDGTRVRKLTPEGLYGRRRLDEVEDLTGVALPEDEEFRATRTTSSRSSLGYGLDTVNILPARSLD